MTDDEHRWWEPTQRRLNLAERERLAALIDEVAALRVALRNTQEAYELCHERADAAERKAEWLSTENRFLHHRRGVVCIQRDSARAWARMWKATATKFRRFARLSQRSRLIVERDELRAVALRLRDAWRAWRVEATAVQRENEMIMARLEAERASMR